MLNGKRQSLPPEHEEVSELNKVRLKNKQEKLRKKKRKLLVANILNKAIVISAGLMYCKELIVILL